MRYDFSKMGSDAFELMVRSLYQSELGIKCQQFGMGPDGQREWLYEGNIKINNETLYSGRTIGQVKYKYAQTKEDDYKWLEKNLKSELEQFKQKDEEYIPNNYIFCTNVVLTPGKDHGIHDKIYKLADDYKDVIPNIIIQGYDEICALLDNNRDVAITYYGHILSGDILNKLLRELHKNYMPVITRFLARQIEEDMYTRMEQAGSVTEKKVSIEKVCVDINVTEEGYKSYKFAKYVITKANAIVGYKKKSDDQDHELDRDDNIVIVGGPGKGKSTICQFIAQMYRANFVAMSGYKNPSIDNFVDDVIANKSYEITCCRIPFIVVLKEYAAWVRQRGNEDNKSLIQYISNKIQAIEGTNIPIEEIRRLLSELPWIFMFDGLDEVPETSNRAEVIGYIRQFINFDLKEASADCFIINTTRPQGYNNEFDETHCCHLEVNELTCDECEEYIEKLFNVMEEKIEYRQEYIGIMKEALSDSTTSRLMKTPLQVTIIAIIVKSGGKPPHERYSLFNQYYETIINREKQKEVITTLNDNIIWLEDIHLKIANRLQFESEKDENPSAEITSDTLRKIITEYIDENKDDDYKLDENIGEKFLNIITNRICFLNENRDGYYSFSIRSMQEYFAGTDLVKGYADKEVRENLENIAYKSYWRNVLLFALGYIEIERKYLLDDIVELCNKMNGRDNLTADTYTEDNICLFGSWLAVDIIVEDIFKGKEKNAFIRSAADLVAQIEHAKSNRLAMISGVSCKKLLEYIYENKSKYDVEQITKFILVIGRNENNDIQDYLDKIWEIGNDISREKIAVEVISSKNRYDEALVVKCVGYIVEKIEKQNYCTLLNEIAISRLLEYVDKDCSVEMRRFLLISAIDGYLNDEQIMKQCIFADNVDVVGLKHWWQKDIASSEIVAKCRITQEINIRVDNIILKKEDILFFSEYSKANDWRLAQKYCKYFLDQSYENYIDVFREWETEKSPFKEKHKKLLVMNDQTPYDESEYYAWLNRKTETISKVNSDSIFDILYSDKEENLTYSCTCAPDVFDKMINDKRFDTINISELGDIGIKIFAFVARVQIEYGQQKVMLESNSVIKEYQLLAELVRRDIVSTDVDLLCYSVILSRAGTTFLRENQRCMQLENMVSQWPLERLVNYRETVGLTYKDQIIILKKIFQGIIDSNEESDFILLIYFMGEMQKSVGQDMCINIVEVLNEIEYRQKINELTSLVLISLMGTLQNAKAAISKIFTIDMPEGIVYKCLISLTLNIFSINRNYILEELYKRIYKSDMEEKEMYQRYILNALLDR